MGNVSRASSSSNEIIQEFPSIYEENQEETEQFEPKIFYKNFSGLCYLKLEEILKEGLLEKSLILRGKNKENENSPFSHEIMSIIFEYLHLKDVIKFSLVCKFWRELLISNDFWKNYHDFFFLSKMHNGKINKFKKVKINEEKINFRELFLQKLLKFFYIEKRSKVFYHPKHTIVTKIAIIGESETGKTSILNKIKYDTFNDAYESTIGAKFEGISFKTNKGNFNVKLNIWDTGGKENYQSLIPVFTAGSDIIIMVYDITRRETFEKIKEKFIRIINDYTLKSSKLPIFIMWGNKKDLKNYEDDYVPIEEVEDFCFKRGITFREVSASNDSQKVLKEFFEEDINEFFLIPEEELKLRMKKK